MAATASPGPSGHQPEAWRRALAASEPGAPWVTYYRPDTGARVELSRATFDNWVAKASGMLAEECDVEQGSTVLLDLAPHWLLPVWAWSTWALGATVVLPGAAAAPSADVCIIDDPTKGVAGGNDLSSGTVLLSSRHPLGLPAGQTGLVPAGAIDALADIRAYPDFRSDPLPPTGALLVTDGRINVVADASLTESLQQTPIRRAALLRSFPPEADGFARALLAPAYHGATLIIGDGGSEGEIATIRHQERVDVDFG